MTAVLACKALNKTFIEGPLTVSVIHDIHFEVEKGESIAIIGPSGAGKSTLLSLLGGLDDPSSGQVYIDGKDFSLQSENERGRIRNASLGFVYQFHHLLGEFTALENVAMPLLIRGEKRQLALSAAKALLQEVGLAHRLDHLPGELSGGERQRVAIARALVGKPSCVLMDEPTGNLDSETATAIHDLLLRLNRELAISLVLVTHDLVLANKMSKVLELRDGRLSEPDVHVPALKGV
jgi:lipoprotein-releasing system ATP-binding protein